MPSTNVTSLVSCVNLLRKSQRWPDRGGQFLSRRYQRILKANGRIGSMGRVASAGGNAAIEPFPALQRNNVLDRQPRKSHKGLTVAIIRWT